MQTQTDPVRILPVETVDPIEDYLRAFKKDHTYSRKRPVITPTTSSPNLGDQNAAASPTAAEPTSLSWEQSSVFGLQSENLAVDGQEVEFLVTSTPIKGAGNAVPAEPIPGPDDWEEESSMEVDEPGEADMTYQPSSDEEQQSSDLEDSSEDAEGPVVQKKYIVFHDALRTLMYQLRCPCAYPPVPTDTVDEYEVGSAITMAAYCINGHQIVKWDSQPKHGRMPLGNLLLSGAILCSGQTYERVAHMCRLINIRIPSGTTYDSYQSDYLIPEINQAWEFEQEAAIMEVLQQDTPVRLAGDGRCDSPGFCAKYCLYSHMDLATNKLLSLQLVQVTETGSSSRMEVLGYERGMEFLLRRGVRIELCATDRHVQVRKKHKDVYTAQGIKHEFDVYHLASHVRKKIKNLAKKPKLHRLSRWVRSLVNHLWWSAATCGGDPDLLVEKWTSVVYHVTNRHEFPEHQLYTECPHGQLEETEERRTRWLAVGSKEAEALQALVMDKRLLRDIRLLSNFCHTGMLHISINCWPRITVVCILYAPNGYNRAAQPDVIKFLWMLIHK